MIPLKHLLNSNTICRLPTFILPSYRRYLATDQSKAQAEIGPSIPELQVNNLTGDLERKFSVIFVFLSHANRCFS